MHATPRRIDRRREGNAAATPAPRSKRDRPPGLHELPLLPVARRAVKGTAGAPAVELDSGGPAVMERTALVRPVTLRRHLSAALPLSESQPKLLLIARRGPVMRFTGRG